MSKQHLSKFNPRIKSIFEAVQANEIVAAQLSLIEYKNVAQELLNILLDEPTSSSNTCGVSALLLIRTIFLLPSYHDAPWELLFKVLVDGNKNLELLGESDGGSLLAEMRIFLSSLGGTGMPGYCDVDVRASKSYDDNVKAMLQKRLHSILEGICTRAVRADTTEGQVSSAFACLQIVPDVIDALHRVVLHSLGNGKGGTSRENVKSVDVLMDRAISLLFLCEKSDGGQRALPLLPLLTLANGCHAYFRRSHWNILQKRTKEEFQEKIVSTSDIARVFQHCFNITHRLHLHSHSFEDGSSRAKARPNAKRRKRNETEQPIHYHWEHLLCFIYQSVAESGNVDSLLVIESMFNKLLSQVHPHFVSERLIPYLEESSCCCAYECKKIPACVQSNIWLILLRHQNLNCGLFDIAVRTFTWEGGKGAGMEKRIIAGLMQATGVYSEVSASHRQCFQSFVDHLSCWSYVGRGKFCGSVLGSGSCALAVYQSLVVGSKSKPQVNCKYSNDWLETSFSLLQGFDATSESFSLAVQALVAVYFEDASSRRTIIRRIASYICICQQALPSRSPDISDKRYWCFCIVSIIVNTLRISPEYFHTAESHHAHDVAATLQPLCDLITSRKFDSLPMPLRVRLTCSLSLCPFVKNPPIFLFVKNIFFFSSRGEYKATKYDRKCFAIYCLCSMVSSAHAIERSTDKLHSGEMESNDALCLLCDFIAMDKPAMPVRYRRLLFVLLSRMQSKGELSKAVVDRILPALFYRMLNFFSHLDRHERGGNRALKKLLFMPHRCFKDAKTETGGSYCFENEAKGLNLRDDIPAILNLIIHLISACNGDTFDSENSWIEGALLEITSKSEITIGKSEMAGKDKVFHQLFCGCCEAILSFLMERNLASKSTKATSYSALRDIPTQEEIKWNDRRNVCASRISKLSPMQWHTSSPPEMFSECSADFILTPGSIQWLQSSLSNIMFKFCLCSRKKWTQPTRKSDASLFLLGNALLDIKLKSSENVHVAALDDSLDFSSLRYDGLFGQSRSEDCFSEKSKLVLEALAFLESCAESCESLLTNIDKYDDNTEAIFRSIGIQCNFIVEQLCDAQSSGDEWNNNFSVFLRIVKCACQLYSQLATEEVSRFWIKLIVDKESNGNTADDTVRLLRSHITLVLAKSVAMLRNNISRKEHAARAFPREIEATLRDGASSMLNGLKLADSCDIKELTANAQLSSMSWSCIAYRLTADLVTGFEGFSGTMTSSLYRIMIDCIAQVCSISSRYSTEFYSTFNVQGSRILFDATAKALWILPCSYGLRHSSLLRNTLRLALNLLPTLSRRISLLGGGIGESDEFAFVAITHCIEKLKQWRNQQTAICSDTPLWPYSDSDSYSSDESDADQDKRLNNLYREKNRKTGDGVLRLRSAEMWSVALCCAFDAIESNWSTSDLLVQGKWNSCTLNSQYMKHRCMILSETLIVLGSLMRKNGFAEKDKNSSKKVLNAELLSEQAKVRLCSSIERIVLTMRRALHVIETSIGENIEQLTSIDLKESLACLGAFLRLRKKKFNLIPACRIWFHRERQKILMAFKMEQKSNIYIEDNASLNRFSNALTRINNFEVKLQKLVMKTRKSCTWIDELLLGTVGEILPSKDSKVRPGKTSHLILVEMTNKISTGACTAVVNSIDSVELRKDAKSKPVEYSFIKSSAHVVKNKKKRDELKRKRKQSNVFRSRNSAVDQFLAMDGAAAEYDSDRDDAFVDLEDFIVL